MTRKNIQDIVKEVNESLDDSQELSGNQRNALMLVHLITTVDDIGSKVDESNNRIASLETAVLKNNNELVALERRVKMLEDNSMLAVVRTILMFIRDNPKFFIILVIIVASALGIAPELIRAIAASQGITIP